MASSRSQKEVKNWPGILDSSCALRRFFYPTAQVAKKQKSMATPPPAAIPAAMPDTIPVSYTEPPTEESTGASAASIVRSEYVAAEKETKIRPPVNAAWQLASDPTNLANFGHRKSRHLKDLKPAKKTERKAWVWAARLERLERAARIEKSEWMEVPQQLEQPSVSSQRIQRLMRPSRPKPKPPIRPSAQRLQRAQKCKPSCPKMPRKKVPKRDLKSLTPIYRRRQPWRFQKTDILVVDAKSKPIQEPKREAAGSSASVRSWQRSDSRHMMAGRSKKASGVPLCQRPTVIMGQGVPYTRQMQMRQNQLFQQPEYHDQYMIMLRQQQQQQYKLQQQHQLEHMQHSHMEQRPGRHPYNYPMSVLGGMKRIAPYAVPSKTQFQRMKRGKLLCGNFYYD